MAMIQDTWEFWGYILLFANTQSYFAGPLDEKGTKSWRC